MSKVPDMKTKPNLKPLLIALLSLPLAAQAAAPDAGTILQEIRQVAPPSPTSSDTGLKIESAGDKNLSVSSPFLVKSIKITGNTLFDTAVLHALIFEAEGKTLTLAQLNEFAGRISDYYHSHGFLLARAIIPAQTISAGEVIIEVIEANYGKINLDNKSRVNDALILDTLNLLQSGHVIEQTGMDRSLLLLADIPGVEVNATLLPGEKIGTADILVQATEKPAASGMVTLDNYGNRYIGDTRLGGTVNLINPLHHGDVLSLSALSSGNGLNHARLGYETLLNGMGTRMGGSWSTLRYKLGNSLALLNANGTAETTSLWAKHPFLRSRNANIFGHIQYEQVKLRDHIDSVGIMTDRQLKNWTTSLNGDIRDTFLSGAVSTWDLAFTSGRVGFDNNAARIADGLTARTEGGYTKWKTTLTRLQTLSPKNELYASFSAQWANTNLDSSQKMAVGGPYTVRAYETSAVSGDTGYFISAEFRHDMGMAWQGQWEAVAFVDSAHVTVNKKVWTTGQNNANLSGLGAGLNWTGQNQWHTKAYIATILGSKPTLVATTASTRAWIEIGRQF